MSRGAGASSRRAHAGRPLRRRASRASGRTTWRRWSSARPCGAPACDPADIEDVILGAANQAGEDNRNVGAHGRAAGRAAGDVAGRTVNRLCGSGLQAVASAAHAIARGRRATCSWPAASSR